MTRSESDCAHAPRAAKIKSAVAGGARARRPGRLAVGIFIAQKRKGSHAASEQRGLAHLNLKNPLAPLPLPLGRWGRDTRARAAAR